MIDQLLTENYESRPSIMEVLRCNFVADQLRDMGYVPQLIGAINDGLKEIKNIVKQQSKNSGASSNEEIENLNQSINFCRSLMPM